MDSDNLDQGLFRSNHSPPPSRNSQGSGQGLSADTTRSPWTFPPQTSSELLSLTLPSTLTPGDIAEHPSLYNRFPSPSDFLLDRPTTPHSHSHSRALDCRSTPQQGRRASLSRSPLHLEDFEDAEIQDPFIDLFQNSPVPSLPADIPIDLTGPALNAMSSQTKKRKSSVEGHRSSVKRRRSSPHDTSSEVKPGIHQAKEVEEVDLVNIDDDESYGAYQSQRQEELIKQQRQNEADKPIKLSDFQCIICLDNPTDLTVTWCGHLFCSICLHEALHASSQKKACPVCRQPIAARPGGKTKSGMFVLSMKLMTSKKKGKQPAGRL